MPQRYAICGLSNRALGSFVRPLLGTADGEDYSSNAEIVAIVDPDQQRVTAFTDQIPWFAPDAFDDMVTKTEPDTVIVTSPDHTHVDYILAALERGLDVISEKPMVTTVADAKRVLAAEQHSEGIVRVTHNMRYSGRHRQIKRLLQQGAVGRITHVVLDWHVDIRHGASYFLRWNRQRDRSGGLSIHKGCHHLDLVTWWLADTPEEVFAYGARNFYGPESPHKPDVPTAEIRQHDPYYQAQLGSGAFPDGNTTRRGLLDLPYNIEYPAGSDKYLYDDEIDIEDTYAAVIRYTNGASLSYSVDFSSPWEGYRLGISGTHGRIEATYGHVPGGAPLDGSDVITYYPLFGQRQVHDVATAAGGHDGADPLLRKDIFGTPSTESIELGLPADAYQGAIAVALGEGVWRSVTEQRPVKVAGALQT